MLSIEYFCFARDVLVLIRGHELLQFFQAKTGGLAISSPKDFYNLIRKEQCYQMLQALWAPPQGFPGLYELLALDDYSYYFEKHLGFHNIRQRKLEDHRFEPFSCNFIGSGANIPRPCLLLIFGFVFFACLVKGRCSICLVGRRINGQAHTLIPCLINSAVHRANRPGPPGRANRPERIYPRVEVLFDLSVGI